MWPITMACTHITFRKDSYDEGDCNQWLTGILADTLATTSQLEHPTAWATTVAPTMEVVTVSVAVHPEMTAQAPRKQPSMGKWPRRHTGIRATCQ